MSVVIGGRTNYGISIGILMLQTRFPRLPGDIGNASTFPFPVSYRVVEGACARRVVMEGDPSLIVPFIDAAKGLIAEGVRTVVTSCGFLALFQSELSEALTVPVYTSSLLQVPLVHAITGRRRVGVLTANSDALTDRHFAAVGAAGIPVAVEGIQHSHFGKVLLADLAEFDRDEAEKNVVDAAKRLVERDCDIGAIVLECTNLPPFAKAVQDVTGLPVFDIVTLTNMAYATTLRRVFAGDL